MKRLILILAVTASAGCATVIRGTKETSRFESVPAGATVTVESISADKLGPFTCVAPCELELKRKRDWNVVFTLDGYKPVTGALEPKVTGGGVAAGVGNVVAGGIIGIGVDAGTGANLDLRPNPMRARLEPVGSAAQSTILPEETSEEKKARKAGKDAKTADPAPKPMIDAAPAQIDEPASAPEPLVMEPVDSPSSDDTE